MKKGNKHNFRTIECVLNNNEICSRKKKNTQFIFNKNIRRYIKSPLLVVGLLLLGPSFKTKTALFFVKSSSVNYK